MTPTRLGLLGGTFDPIHCGHIDIGTAADAALGLTGLVVIPSNIPPHRSMPVATPFHRFAMVALAIAGRAHWRVSDAELREPSPSYTTTTLERMQRRGYRPVELFFIIGADAFADIASWKNYPAVLEQAHFAVVSRPGLTVRELMLRVPWVAGRTTEPTPTMLGSTTPLIFLIDAPTADVSATAIRQRRAAGESIHGLVPPSVEQHIEQHGLYANPAGSGAAPAEPAAGRLHGQN
jgi:nicotinate-nucleotide adenylyltransferase